MRQQRTKAAEIEAEIARLRSLALDVLTTSFTIDFSIEFPLTGLEDTSCRQLIYQIGLQAHGSVESRGEANGLIIANLAKSHVYRH
jgi:hypothetical protein